MLCGCVIVCDLYLLLGIITIPFYSQYLIPSQISSQMLSFLPSLALLSLIYQYLHLLTLSLLLSLIYLSHSPIGIMW